MRISRDAARLVIVLQQLLLLLLSTTPRPSSTSQHAEEEEDTTTMGGRIYRVVASHRLAYCTQLAVAGRTVGCRSRPAGNLGRVRWLAVDNATGRDDVDERDQPIIGAVGLADFVQLWRANFSASRMVPMGSGRLAGLIVLLSGREEEANGSRRGLAELAQCGLSADDDDEEEEADACVDGLAGVAAQFTIPFPVVLLATSTLEAVTGQSLQQLQRQRHLWAVLTFSYAGIGSGRDCLRRQRLLHSRALGQFVTGELGSGGAGSLCQRMSETSLAWSVAELPTGRSRRPASVLLVVARLDTFSVFSNWAAGAAQLRPGLAVALAMAGALADWAKSSSPLTRAAWGDRDVVLLLLTGESHGHLASRSVARRLLGDPPGLLGDPGQPAGIRAGHLHSAIEVGPLGFAGLADSHPGRGQRRRRRQFRFVGAGSAERLRSHRGVAGLANVTESAAFPAWSTLGHLAPAVGGLAGLLLTDLHGNGSGQQLRYPDWNSFTDQAADADPAALTAAAGQLIRLAVGFLLGGDAAASAAAAAAAVPSDLSERVARAAACLDPVGSGHVCRDLLAGGGVVGGGAALARSLERWRRLGVDASLGGLGPTEGRWGGDGGGSREAASGMRLLVGSLLLRYTLREGGGGGGGGDCSGMAATEQEPPVRGYQWRHPNGTVTCWFSSITSFPVGDDEGAWALSTQEAFPSLSLFARPPAAAQLPVLGLGLALALLWAHLTASAKAFFLTQRE